MSNSQTSAKSRVIIWQSGDWFNFVLANSLKNYDLDLYAIIDVTNKPKKFFQQQSFVPYKKIWFYHDYVKKTNAKPDIDYLRDFEKKYKIDLWLLAYNERIFFEYNPFYKFTTEEIYSILEQECRFFESVIDEIKPHFLIISLTTFHYNHLFYLLCKAKDIKVLMTGPTEFGFNASRLMISEEVTRIDYFTDHSIKNKAANVTFEKLQEYLKIVGSYQRVIQYKNQFNKSKNERLKAGLKFLFSPNENIKTHYTYYGRTKLKVIHYEILSLLQTKYRENFIDRNFIRKISDSEKFFYFPLHVDQERSLLIGSPFYTNQLEVIKHIVKSLPVGYKLYVKEHPSMKTRNWRSVSFYKEILKLPNVSLVHHSVNTEELIKKCSLLISIAGTAAFEAAFYGKPSIVFTNRGHDLLSARHYVTSIDELPRLIEKALQTTVDVNELASYVKIIESNSIEFDYISFILDYGEYFYLGSNLVDVDISNEKMQIFLERHKSKFDKLAEEYIKKINIHKQILSKC